MDSNKLDLIKKLANLFCVLLLINASFVSLTAEKVAAQVTIPSDVSVIAEKYKDVNEQYYIYYTDDGSVYSTNYWYIVAYIDSITGDISGSIVIDSNLKPLLFEDINSKDMFYLPALAYHYGLYNSQDIETYSLKEANEADILKEAALADKNNLDINLAELNLIGASYVVLHAGSLMAGFLIETPIYFAIASGLDTVVGAFDVGGNLVRILKTKEYFEKISATYLDLANLYEYQSNLWLEVFSGSYKNIMFLIPGSGSYDEITSTKYEQVLGLLYNIAALGNNQNLMSDIILQIDAVESSKNAGRYVVRPKIEGYYNDLVSNYRYTNTADEMFSTDGFNVYPTSAAVGYSNTKLLIIDTMNDNVPSNTPLKWFIVMPTGQEITGEDDIFKCCFVGALYDEAYYDFPVEGTYTIKVRVDNSYYVSWNVNAINDVAPPSGNIRINSGDEYNTSTSVSLTLSASDLSSVTEMQFSNDGTSWSSPEPFNTMKSWTLTSGDGTKQVFAKFKDGLNNWMVTPVQDTIILDTSPPILSNLVTGGITRNKAMIYWDTDESSDSVVEFGTTSSYGDSTSESYAVKKHVISLTGLSAGKSYHFRVKSTDEREFTAVSPDYTFTTENTPPNIPSNPAPQNSAVHQQINPTLSWNGGDSDSGDVVTYNVTLDTNPNPITQIYSGTSLSSSISGLSYGTTYYWKVVATDNHGFSTPGPVWSFTTNFPPYKPNTPYPANNSINIPINPTLSWNGGDPENDPVTYDVKFGTSSNPTTKICTTQSTSCNPGVLYYGMTYYWTVLATDSKGASTQGPIWSFTTLKTVHNLQSGEDFGYIQSAIDDPQTLDGHTLIVDPRIYNENVDVTKGVKIIGSGAANTIIKPENPAYSSFYVTANDVEISNFKIEDAGIDIEQVYGCTINNNILNASWGVNFKHVNDCTIKNNIIKSNKELGDWGISLFNSSNFVILNNSITQASDGIRLDSSSNNIIEKNTIRDSWFHGMWISNIYDYSYGSNNNVIRENDFINNERGIKIYWSISNNNSIYHNYFKNTFNHWDDGNNQWDSGSIGNYYSNFDEPTEGCSDSNSDFVCDSGFNISFGQANAIDRYPLTSPNSVAYGPMTWTASNFPAFWYDEKDNLMTEQLSVSQIDISNIQRTIDIGNLYYNTTKVLKSYNVYSQLGRTVNGGLDGSGVSTAFGGYYAIVGWLGKPYVAINGKASKLTEIVMEKGTKAIDKKTLTVGDTWELGDGWTLLANSIDAKASPRQVWFVLSKDGVKVDDKVISQGDVYTFTRDFAGELDVPVFVTYIDTIFAGDATDMVQLRYTWLISEDKVKYFNTGDKHGELKVVTANQSVIILRNSDDNITLSNNSTANVFYNLSLVATNNSLLEYYPFATFDISDNSSGNGSVGEDVEVASFDTMVFEPDTWNLVSVPKPLNDSSIDVAFGNMSFDTNNVKWYFNTFSGTPWNHPSEIKPLMGYWVYNNASSNISQKLQYKNMSGPISPYISLNSGWNLIGHTSTSPISVSSALVSIDGKYSHLLSYSSKDGWKMYLNGNPSLQEFTSLEPGKGYWIFMTQNATYSAVEV